MVEAANTLVWHDLTPQRRNESTEAANVPGGCLVRTVVWDNEERFAVALVFLPGVAVTEKRMLQSMTAGANV